MKQKNKMRGLFLSLTLLVGVTATCVATACDNNEKPQASAHYHTYSNDWSHDEFSHWHAATCEHKDERREQSPHAMQNYVCTVCGYDNTPHVHTYSKDWSSDDAYHWHAATCEHTTEVQDKIEHTFSEDNICDDCGYTYTLGTLGLRFRLSSDGESAILYSVSNAKETDIVVPSSYQGKPVTQIGENAHLNGADKITSIVIPDTVTEIQGVFRHAKNLTSITLGKGVTKIGAYAFYGCAALTEVRISDLTAWCNIDFEDENSNPLYNHAYPRSVKNLYLNDVLVTDLVIPEGVTTIKNRAFSYCTSITSLTVAASVTKIEDSAFDQCSNLKSIVVPATVTDFDEENGRSIFRGCSIESASVPAHFYGGFNSTKGEPLKTLIINGGTELRGSYGGENLTSITLCDGLLSIQASFAYSPITSIEIPDSVQMIGEGVFNSCTELQEIELPASLTSIGAQAFQNCHQFVKLTLPQGVTSIGNNAFENCYRLVEVCNLSDTLNVTKGGEDNGKVGYFAKRVYTDASQESFVSVTDDGFITYANPTDGEYLLVGYIGKESEINLPYEISGNPYEIGQYAFYNNNRLVIVKMSDRITKINGGAFWNCKNLAHITLGSALKKIESASGSLRDAFAGCEKLVEVANRSSLEIENNREGYGKVAKNALRIYQAFNGSGNESWISIDENGYILYDGSSDARLIGYVGTENDLVLPDNIYGAPYVIHKYAFKGKDIVGVELGQWVTEIGERAFANNDSLTTVVVPEYTQEDIQYDRYLCKVGYYAFGDTMLSSMSIAGLKEISEYSFYCCDFEIIEVGVVDVIGERAFYDCDKATKIKIEHADLIERDAFAECTEVTEIHLGYVGEMKRRAFGGLTKLTDIYYVATMEEWKAIVKAEGWDNSTGDYVVHCSDGDIAKDGTEIPKA